MPIGIVETAIVLAAAKGTYTYVKKRNQRSQRRKFFKSQRKARLGNIEVADVVTVRDDSTVIVPQKVSITGVEPITPDQLEEIWGIGPVYVERLHDAGISTFSALAALSPDRLLEIVAPNDGMPHPAVEDWITQAAELAK